MLAVIIYAQCNTETIESRICVHGVSALERASQLITLMTEQRLTF